MSYLNWFIKNFEEAMGAILLFSMALIAFINVLTRYFIHYSFAFTEELEVSGMVFLTMLGASAGFKRDLHLKVLFLNSIVNEEKQKYLLTLSYLLSFLLFMTLLYFSYFHIKDTIELDIRTEALNIPEWIYVSSVPLGSILIIFRILQKIFNLWSRK